VTCSARRAYALSIYIAGIHTLTSLKDRWDNATFMSVYLYLAAPATGCSPLRRILHRLHNYSISQKMARVLMRDSPARTPPSELILSPIPPIPGPQHPIDSHQLQPPPLHPLSRAKAPPLYELLSTDVLLAQLLQLLRLAVKQE
jgi:hypothetical protein